MNVLTLEHILPEPYPDRGGTAAPEAMRTEIDKVLQRVSIALYRLRTTIQTAASNKGETAQKVQTMLTEVIRPVLEEVHRNVQDAQGALIAYENAMESICGAVRRVRLDADELLLQIRTDEFRLSHMEADSGVTAWWDWDTQLSEARNEFDYLLPYCDVDLEKLNWPDYVLAHNRNKSRIESLKAQWVKLQNQREIEEHKLSGILRRVVDSLGSTMRGHAQLLDFGTSETVRILKITDSASAIKELGFLVGDVTQALQMGQRESSEELLERAKKDPKAVYAELGFVNSGLSFSEFKTDISKLNDEISAARAAGVPTELLNFGRHRDTLVAAIGYGGVKEAKRVAVVVPGMFSNVGDIGGLGAAARGIYKDAKDQDKDAQVGVIAWQGYDSPELLEEPQMTKANAGAMRLRDTLKSLQDKEWVGLYGHSYGTTTAGQSLKYGDVHVDTFLMLGSAGLSDGTKRNDIHAHALVTATNDPLDRLYSAVEEPQQNAWKKMENIVTVPVDSDHWAIIGRNFGEHKTNPKDLANVRSIKVKSKMSHALSTAETDTVKGYITPGTGTFKEAVRLLLGK